MRLNGRRLFAKPNNKTKKKIIYFTGYRYFYSSRSAVFLGFKNNIQKRIT